MENTYYKTITDNLRFAQKNLTRTSYLSLLRRLRTHLGLQSYTFDGIKLGTDGMLLLDVRKNSRSRKPSPRKPS